MKGLDWLWPYPRILPENISWHHQTFDRQAGCHTLAWYDRGGGVSGAKTAVRVGSVSSALLFRSAPVYAPVLSLPAGLSATCWSGLARVM